MAIEYNNVYFQIEHKTLLKSIMVSIPFYMYRIETNEFEEGLNFFQKIVIKLKAKPGITDERIAEYTGLDTKLIQIVTSQLQLMQLINEYGSLSDKGKEKLNEIDELIVHSSKKKIGYVFKYLNQDKLYQYYVSHVDPADLLEDSKNQHPKIVTGTRGDGEDKYEIPISFDNVYNSKKNYNRPTEREVLMLIQNSNRKAYSQKNDESKNEKLSNQLSVRFINEQPEIVWVCTYVYLYKNEDETYEPDWRVLDPFGFGDNVALKFYINNLKNKDLLERIHTKFSDAKTLGGKLLSDYQEQVKRLIEEKLISDFSYGFIHLDKNLQMYLEAIIKNLILIENHNYNDLDSSVSFTLNLQNTLENILKLDKEKRATFYQYVFTELDNDPMKKKTSLIGIYRQRIFSSNTQVPQPLLNVSKGTLSRANSLLSYLVSLMLTYNYDNKSILFKILRDKVELLIEVAHLRNEKGHGQTSNEKELKPLSKEEVEKFYGFIKTLINDYLQNS